MSNEIMIPYIAHESELARQERTIKRLWVLCIILIALLFGTNAGWLFYEAQWQVVESEVTQDIDAEGDGELNINAVGGDYYGDKGESETDN